MSITGPDFDPKAEGAVVGAQLSELIRRATLHGTAKSLGKQLADETKGDGPWTIHADGTVEPHDQSGAWLVETINAQQLLSELAQWDEGSHLDAFTQNRCRSTAARLEALLP